MPSHSAPVRMVDLCERHRRVAPALEDAVLELLRSGGWVGGPKVAACEQRLAPLFGRVHGVGLNSGTDAVMLALEALGVQAGDEVIVPAFTFFATAGAVCRMGARPVVADVLEDQPLMDPASVHDCMSVRTRAVIPVHLFGMACPDPQVEVHVIEDSAQAVGLTPAPRLGSITALSLYPTKTLGAAGDAGMAATDDPDLATRIRRLANHGGVLGEAHLHEQVSGHVGTNSRLDPLQAVIVLAHLDDLPARLNRRRHLSRSYDEALPPTQRPRPRSPGDPIHQYALRTSHRDALRRHMTDRGIESAIYYPRSLASQPAIAPQPPTPRADLWCQEILSLPCHIGVGDLALERVCTALHEFRP